MAQTKNRRAWWMGVGLAKENADGLLGERWKLSAHRPFGNQGTPMFSMFRLRSAGWMPPPSPGVLMQMVRVRCRSCLILLTTNDDSWFDTLCIRIFHALVAGPAGALKGTPSSFFRGTNTNHQSPTTPSQHLD